MKKTTIILSALILLFFVNNSFADETKEVEIFVNELGNKIVAVVGNNKIKLNQKREILVNIIDEVVDTKWIAKFVLGKYYKTITAEQKEKFAMLYHDFMVNTYSPKFTGYNGEKFSITSINKDENYYTAKCIFYPSDNAPNMNFDFRIRKNTNGIKPKFLVFDILAEGVSLIETQRSEFGSVIAKDGLEKLMADLQVKTNDIKTQNFKSKTVKSKAQ